MVLSWRTEDWGWMSGGSSLLWEWWGAGTGWPERLWMNHPWRCSRPGWKRPCAAWSSIKCGGWWPCLWRGVWSFTILEVPSNPSHTMILWFTSADVTVILYDSLCIWDGVHWGNAAGCAGISRYANLPLYKRCCSFPQSVLQCFTACLWGQFP